MSTNSVSIDTGAVSSEISRASAVNDNINSQYQAAQSHLSEIENAIETTSTKIQAELPKIEKKNADLLVGISNLSSQIPRLEGELNSQKNMLAKAKAQMAALNAQAKKYEGLKAGVDGKGVTTEQSDIDGLKSANFDRTVGVTSSISEHTKNIADITEDLANRREAIRLASAKFDERSAATSKLKQLNSEILAHWTAYDFSFVSANVSFISLHTLSYNKSLAEYSSSMSATDSGSAGNLSTISASSFSMWDGKSKGTLPTGMTMAGISYMKTRREAELESFGHSKHEHVLGTEGTTPQIGAAPLKPRFDNGEGDSTGGGASGAPASQVPKDETADLYIGAGRFRNPIGVTDTDITYMDKKVFTEVAESKRDGVPLVNQAPKSTPQNSSQDLPPGVAANPIGRNSSQDLPPGVAANPIGRNSLQDHMHRSTTESAAAADAFIKAGDPKLVTDVSNSANAELNKETYTEALIEKARNERAAAGGKGE